MISVQQLHSFVSKKISEYTHVVCYTCVWSNTNEVICTSVEVKEPCKFYQYCQYEKENQ